MVERVRGFLSKARKSSATEDGPDSAPTKKAIRAEFTVHGVAFANPRPGREWLQDCVRNDEDSELASLLSQVEEEGYARWEKDTLMLSWDSIFQLGQSSDYGDVFRIMALPQMESWRPVLQSSNGFADEDFSIFVAGWIAPSGGRSDDQAVLTGAILQHNGKLSMLDSAAWGVVSAIHKFHQREAQERTADSNRRAWAEIRKRALAANADLSDFLRHTVVLTPDRLRLDLRRGDENASDLVEVIPTFELSPQRWIEFFDRNAEVPSRYDIPDREGLTQILLPEATRSVLREIKRMPGRRIVGGRAEAFVRNPFAMLGPDANAVIDPIEFEAAREAAGLAFTKFSPSLLREKEGVLIGVGLRIQEVTQGRVREELLPFESPHELQAFLSKITQRLDRGAQCCSWSGFDLEILGDTREHVDLLQSSLEEWGKPKPFSASEILDLSGYSERVQGFGIEKPYYCPFIARKNDLRPWVPDNLVSGVFFTPADSPDPIALELDEKALEEFRRELQAAKAESRDTFTFLGCPRPVKTAEAEQILVSLDAARSDISKEQFDPKKRDKDQSTAMRSGLVIKPNILDLDYEERRGSLTMPTGLRTRLPNSLRPEFPLKDHQMEGVRWLQHLWSKCPNDCRGALLADDMGLGKTLQLLTFLAAQIEDDPNLDPCLIVAPVSLLENWKDEINKFFESGTLSCLTLYGARLSTLRLSRSEIDAELRSAGVGKLLVRNWLGGSRIVLTTYETLRDLEFSLSRQKWSIMICDEAQKIKNPNALVSRAAKKQNARFKIACTGTPVENTLTDLWCLFDFIQPGLLGSLTRFGQRYRMPIEAETEDEKARVRELREIIEPQKLRRMKHEVAKDLPRKVEVEECRSLLLSERQRAIYSQEVDRFRKNSLATLSDKSASTHLGLLQKLRRICSDPQALYGPAVPELLVEAAKHSPKLSWMLIQLHRIHEKAEKAIIFCELRDLQRKLQAAIAERFGIVPEIINGETATSADNPNNRQARIKQFQAESGFGVIILSPLAVGFGVNIQGANHVIHFTRTWNPAKEDQATDRAYRIGQTKDVFVYYPVVVAPDFTTFDAKLDSLLTWKRGLSQDMLNGTGDLTSAEFADLQNVDGACAFNSD
jgi:superfamily II DNA or RNA helicase